MLEHYEYSEYLLKISLKNYQESKLQAKLFNQIPKDVINISRILYSKSIEDNNMTKTIEIVNKPKSSPKGTWI
jgi:hypothetical protein